MENAMNNCVVKGALSGVMGFGMGGLFGLFMASVRYTYRSSFLCCSSVLTQNLT
jgi:hypothetical protein